MWTSKLTVFLLLVCLLKSRLVSAQGNGLISLNERNVPLEKVLQDIRDKAGFSYYGEAGWPQLSRPVTIIVDNASVREVLEHCFRDQPLYYTIDQRAIFVHIRPREERDVHGFVYDENMSPVPGVFLRAAGDASAVSDDDGEFTLHMHLANNHLFVSSIAYEPQEAAIPERGKDMHIILKSRVGSLEAVVVHTGYQEVRRGNTTGSVEQIDNNLLNRRISTNILDRIDGIASSVLFNKNIVSGINQSTITIRGRSTIFANPNPLVVVDNFPYRGDLNNINPADVESITVLKDAAAASIWGAFSGNGVIVITTRKGKLNETPRFSFTSSVTVGEKPNLFYQPILSSNDYITIQDSLFHWGYYDNALATPTSGALNPAVEIMDSGRLGLLSAADVTAKIDVFRKQDLRKDLKKYFYRPSINSQYALSVSGGSDQDVYYLSAGYDRNISNLKRNEYDRMTLTGNNSYQLIPSKLELTTGVAFTSSATYLENPGGDAGVNYPYAQLADAQGRSLPVALHYRLPYVDTVGGGKLLDWHYSPIQELKEANNKLSLTDYRVNIGLRYSLLKGLDARAYYQYGHGDSDLVNYYSPQTWYARDKINAYTQVSPNGAFSYPVPLGGILNEYDNAYTVNNARLQLNYNDSVWRGRLNIIAGAEVQDIEGKGRVNWLYGYDPNVASSMPVDYVNYYTSYITGQEIKIPYNDVNAASAERYLSYYANGVYTYLDRYMFSASARRDESNIFGVKTNQKGVPLWSGGLAWQISKENFYHSYAIPFLKFRFTDGYNGNVDRDVSAYTTASVNTGVNNFNAITASIVNPPNPNLRWERIHIYNWGVDFATVKNRFGGSLEYYIKRGLDLIGQSPIDPTTGVSVFTGNTADMLDHGVDITLRTDNSFGGVRWSSALLFSYVKDRVTKYEPKPGSVTDYLNPATINPLIGRPLYSVYAVRWGGLTADGGDPQGRLLDGKTTVDYGSILGSDTLSNMVYKGPVNPPIFGSWRNGFYWRQWGLSFNIVYKFGYVFRRNSMFYTPFYQGSFPGYPDFDHRWQNPGDEKFTNVPSMEYPANANRDLFYQNSDILVVKGDHIRLQDIELSYDYNKRTHPGLPVQQVRFYLYANNIGILWKANHVGIDPDYVMGYPEPRTFALGVKIDY